MHIILHPVTLSIDPQIRIVGGPRFSNTYLEDSNRDPQSNIMWDTAKWEWQLQFVGGSILISQIMGFQLARGAGAYAWWFVDPFDQTSIDHAGQGFVRLASDGLRYLTKIYPDTDSYSPYQRRIRCPVQGSVNLTGIPGATGVDFYSGQVYNATADGPCSFSFRNPVKFASDFMPLEREPGDAGTVWQQIQVQEVGKFVVAQ